MHIKQILAEHIGTEADEIKGGDSLVNDLHMSPSDLSDFIHLLQSKNIDTSKVDLTQVGSVRELIEAIGSEEIIE